MSKPAALLEGTLDLGRSSAGKRDPGPMTGAPLVTRLADQGWTEGEWGELDETERRAKFYAITPACRKRLAQEKRNWNRASIAVSQALTEES